MPLFTSFAELTVNLTEKVKSNVGAVANGGPLPGSVLSNLDLRRV